MVKDYRAQMKNYPVYTAEWSKAVTDNNGEVIWLMDVPVGLVVDYVEINFGATASGTVKVGDTVNDARFITSTSTTSANVARTNAPATLSSGLVSVGPAYRYTAVDKLILTLGGANFIANTITVKVFYHYDYTV